MYLGGIVPIILFAFLWTHSVDKLISYRVSFTIIMSLLSCFKVALKVSAHFSLLIAFLFGSLVNVVWPRLIFDIGVYM